MKTKLRNTYSGVGVIFHRYWSSYGGVSALISSPYLHLSILFSAASTYYWTNSEWWEVALSALPNLLGFTLAGFTIWLSLADEKFKKLLWRDTYDGSSAFEKVNATFVHFVVVQVIALGCALWAKAMNFPLPSDHWLRPFMTYLKPMGNAIGYSLFLYAVTTILAVTFGVFRTATWMEKSWRIESSRQDIFRIKLRRKAHNTHK